MMKPIFLSLILVLVTISSNSQTSYSVSGIVNEGNGQAAAFANVLLLKSADSTLVKGTITLEDGSYEITQVDDGNYVILSSLVGFQSIYSRPFELNDDYRVETLILSEGEQLGEVVVEARKPLYQQKVDRMVINVESSIVSAGGSALEILERSPGVVVNRQSNSLSLVGKDGVEVMINGKRKILYSFSVEFRKRELD